MNWPVLKDKKWWMSLVISITLSITAVILAAFENEYWIVTLIISLFIASIGVKRASNLTYKVKQ